MSGNKTIKIIAEALNKKWNSPTKTLLEQGVEGLENKMKTIQLNFEPAPVGKYYHSPAMAKEYSPERILNRNIIQMEPADLERTATGQKFTDSYNDLIELTPTKNARTAYSYQLEDAVGVNNDIKKEEKKLFGFTREEATQKWRSGEISHSVLGDIIDFENNYKVDEYDVIDKAFKMDLVDIVYSDRDGISVNPNYFKKHAKKARLNVNI